MVWSSFRMDTGGSSWWLPSCGRLQTFSFCESKVLLIYLSVGNTCDGNIRVAPQEVRMNSSFLGNKPSPDDFGVYVIIKESAGRGRKEETRRWDGLVWMVLAVVEEVKGCDYVRFFLKRWVFSLGWKNVEGLRGVDWSKKVNPLWEAKEGERARGDRGKKEVKAK